MKTKNEAVDAVYVLNKLGLEPGMSITRALTHIGLQINDGHQHGITVSNKIIKSLGGNPEQHPVAADIMAKALIEQAVLTGSSYDVQAAIAVAEGKLAKIRTTMPYAFATETSSKNTQASSARARKATSRGGDKKERARVIFDREAGKPAGTVAKIIASEIDITYANAYYYVSRVFK